MNNWHGKTLDYRDFLLSIIRNRITVADLHPSLFVNQDDWDSIYHKGNPKQIVYPLPRRAVEIESLFHGFDSFLKGVKYLENARLIDACPNLIESNKNLVITKRAAAESYETSIKWAKRFFNYKPQYLRNHFLGFFEACLFG
jgi:hypothetical protein